MAKYAHPDKLVTTEWVADHLNDPQVCLIEVDVDTSSYDDEGHPSGAVAWNWTSQLQDPLRRDVADRATVERLLREAGVDGDSTIILYGDNNNWFAAHALWMLEMYGVGNTSLMDGGSKKWLAEGRLTTTEAPRPKAGTIAVGERDEATRALSSAVLQHVEAGKLLVDVRSPDEYNGLIMAPPGLAETAQRKGHIPGAANIPWSQAVAEDGTFQSADALQALYSQHGADGSAPVIAYCRIGERSSHTWFVLKHLLGYENVRNYDGSWTEWGSMVGMPVANPSAES